MMNAIHHRLPAFQHFRILARTLEWPRDAPLDWAQIPGFAGGPVLALGSASSPPAWALWNSEFPAASALLPGPSGGGRKQEIKSRIFPLASQSLLAWISQCPAAKWLASGGRPSTRIPTVSFVCAHVEYQPKVRIRKWVPWRGSSKRVYWDSFLLRGGSGHGGAPGSSQVSWLVLQRYATCPRDCHKPSPLNPISRNEFLEQRLLTQPKWP
jgi:hypothetical protein